MSLYDFQSIGPLAPGSSLYIERDAEGEALTILRSVSPDFMLITEPRQYGKTSFINYLLGHTDLEHCCFVNVNAAQIRQSTSESDWYTLIDSETRRQLHRYNLPTDVLPLCAIQEQWRDQLLVIGQAALDRHRVVVVMIDEVGRLPTAWREAFFAAICEIRDSRATTPAFNAITFLFVGSFRPEAMITDGNISPFNKARPLALDDFTYDQVAALLGHAGLPNELAEALLPRLMYWTDGQPYLVQALCAALHEGASPRISDEVIDRAAHRLERCDKVLLPPIFRQLRANKRWCRHAERILNREEIEFAPASLIWQAELSTIGLIKEQKSTGLCIIRNPIYARALRRMLQEQREDSDKAEDPNVIVQHLTKVIHEQTRRCQQLELTAAKYGKDVPPHVALEIEDIYKEIARLHEQLQILE